MKCFHLAFFVTFFVKVPAPGLWSPYCFAKIGDCQRSKKEMPRRRMAIGGDADAFDHGIISTLEVGEPVKGPRQMFMSTVSFPP